jgi:peptide/nickel transport system permease protein
MTGSAVADRSRGRFRRSPGDADRAEWLSVLLRAATSRRGAIGLALAGTFFVLAAVGPFVAPHSPTEFVTTSFGPPGSGVPLGGDVLGRDVLSRVLAGGWVLLIIAIVATALGLALGTAAGITAAYVRGRWDGGIMRTVDVILAFPPIIFALLIVSIVGPKVWAIIAAVATTHVPQVARVIRSATLDVSERDFVKAMELNGIKKRRIMVNEILPNLLTPITVEAGLRLTYSILIVASLGFLGFGQAPPAPNWGTMINENFPGLQDNPWAVIAPAICIAAITVGMNTFTDAVARASLGEGHNRFLLGGVDPALGVSVNGDGDTETPL